MLDRTLRIVLIVLNLFLGANAIIGAIWVIPAAMWSAIRSVATTCTHHGVQRSLSAQMSTWSRRGIHSSPSRLSPGLEQVAQR